MSIPTKEQLIERLDKKLLIMRCLEPLSDQWLRAEETFLNLLMFNSGELSPEEKIDYDSLYQNTNTAYFQENQLIAVA